VEVLKQAQYAPYSVDEQVMVLYAVTNGHLDAVPTNRVREWERGFLDYARAQHPGVGEGIRTSKAIGKDAEAELKTAIAGYNRLFGAGAAAAPAARAA
jgi:F-type H+-transporting ATPase subunit alpha